MKPARLLLLLVLIGAGIGLPLALQLGAPGAAAAGKGEADRTWQEPLPLRAEAADLAPLPAPPAIMARDRAALTLRPTGEIPAARCLRLTLRGPGGARRFALPTDRPITLADLTPGRWALTLAPAAAIGRQAPLWRREIPLAPGEKHTLDLPCLPGAALAGRVRGPGPTAVTLRTAAGLRHTETDGEGRFAFTGLPAGPALLVAADAGSRQSRSRWVELELTRGERTEVGTIELGR